MIHALLLVATLVFFEAFVRLDALAPMRVLVNVGPEGLRTIASSTVSDDEKERIARQLSKRMFRATLELILKLTLATAAAALAIWLGARLLSVPLDALEDALLSLPVIIGLLVATLGYARLRHVIF